MKSKFIVTTVIVAIISSVIGSTLTYNFMKSRDNSNVSNINIIGNNSSKSQNVYQAVAEKASPSVVGIISETTSTDNIFNIPEAIQDSGTGIIVDKRGYILTNAHVVGNGNTNNVKVIYNHGKTTNGKVLYYDNTLDIAVVKIKEKNLVPAELGNSDNVKIGDIAIAIGNPLGTDLMSTVTQGIISGLDRTIQTKNSTMSGLIQTDASINPGNSGGPLLNQNGQVIGINTVKAKADNLGFAIPINEAKIIVENVIKNNGYKAMHFGIRGADVNTLNTELQNGIYVNTVLKDSMADKLGVEPGDILIKINDKKMNNLGDLKKFLYAYKKGEKITGEVLRYNGHEYKVVKLK